MDTILNIEIMHIIQLLIAIFIAICLLQSGADKIIDFQGNKEYFLEHFANSHGCMQLTFHEKVFEEPYFCSCGCYI